MSVDSGLAVLAKVVTALEGVGTKALGKVFDHQPIWRQPKEMNNEAKVVIGGRSTHRFVVIEHFTDGELFTNQSDLAIHMFEVEIWVGAGIDKNFGRVTTATARTLVAQALDSVRDQSVLSTGATFCGFTPEGVPKEVEKMEYRELLGTLFHVAKIEFATREEVDHV